MTTLAWGPNANNISPRLLVVENKRFLSSPGSSRLKNLQLKGCTASLSRGLALPGVEDSPRAETGAERTSYDEERRLERLEEEKKRGGRVGGEWCGAGASGGGGGEVCGGILLHAA